MSQQERVQHFNHLPKEDQEKLLKIMQEDDQALAMLIAAGAAGDIMAAEAVFAYGQLVEVQRDDNGNVTYVGRHGE